MGQPPFQPFSSSIKGTVVRIVGHLSGAEVAVQINGQVAHYLGGRIFNQIVKLQQKKHSKIAGKTKGGKIPTKGKWSKQKKSATRVYSKAIHQGQRVFTSR